MIIMVMEMGCNGLISGIVVHMYQTGIIHGYRIEPQCMSIDLFGVDYL